MELALTAGCQRMSQNLTLSLSPHHHTFNMLFDIHTSPVLLIQRQGQWDGDGVQSRGKEMLKSQVRTIICISGTLKY